jgi:hypothetical protein
MAGIGPQSRNGAELMTDPLTTGLVLGTFVVALVGAVLSYRTLNALVEIGKNIDGRLSDLLAITRKDALAEGRLEGKADR